MTKEIFINCTSTETRLALVENAVLRQIHIDRQESLSLVGNIYKAKVLRVMPGMQAAFVDIGDTRNAFIHIDGVHRANSGRLRYPMYCAMDRIFWFRYLKIQ
jgi:ribonuclease G